MMTETLPAVVGFEILAVEDSPTQAQELKYILELHGYRVTLARNGVQALSYLNGYKPALVISDINMPEMNGYEFCQKLKTAEATRLIPVILLTSLADIDDVIEGLVCGAHSFITKPYSKNYLLRHIEETLLDTNFDSAGRDTVEVKVNLGGKPRTITTDCQQMLSLLFSVYKAAIHRNKELLDSQEALSLFNEHLELLVEERTAALSSEIVERERLQTVLQALSLNDELTGLNNRRGFMTLAEQHLKLAVRARQDFTLMYMDLDNFKHINDTFGHAQGDQALRTVARVLEQTFRDSDILARFGGDEFTVLCTECDLASGQAAVLRLKAGLKQEVAEAAGLYNLSSSVGLAHFNANSPTSIKELLALADAEMYNNKLRAHKSRERSTG
jgi:two-component system, cell cycle response regulator